MYKRPSFVNERKAQKLRWAGHVLRSPNKRFIKTIWEESPVGKPLGRLRLRWRDNIGEDLKVWEVRDWKEVVLDRDRWRRVVDAAPRSPTKGCDALREERNFQKPCLIKQSLWKCYNTISMEFYYVFSISESFTHVADEITWVNYKLKHTWNATV